MRIAREQYIQKAFPRETELRNTLITIVVADKQSIATDVSIIFCPCAAMNVSMDSSDSEPQSLIFLHGVGSSATLISSSSIAALREKYNVYVIDIPGFGTSNTSVSLASLSTDLCLEYYSQFFDKLLAELALKQPLVVAHSVGSFLAVHSMRNWDRKRIGGIVMVSPAGILPTLTAAGAYWALLFKAGLPMSLFRCFGSTISSFLFLPLLGSTTCARTIYWLQMQSSMSMVNIPSKFIHLGFATSYWAHPQLNDILRSKLKFGMIWGEKDDLMPLETGRLLVDIGRKLGKKFVLEPVPGAGHSPFHVNGGTDFVQALHKVVAQMEASDSSAPDGMDDSEGQNAGEAVDVSVCQGNDSAAHTVHNVDEIVHLERGKWRSSFSMQATRKRVKALHEAIEAAVDSYVQRTKSGPGWCS